VHFGGDRAEFEPLLPVVADELNVQRVVFAGSADELGRWCAKPNYRVLGPRLGPHVKDVAAALAADEGSLAAALAGGDAIEVPTPSGDVTLSASDVELSQEIREGWGVASDGGLTVALDLELTPELRREWLARELVRLVQDARKAAGLNVSDRIVLGVRATGDVADALEAHRDYVAGETLAVELTADAGGDEAYRQEGEIDATAVSVSLRRA
jgi:isoleucyl-tRNA synthetase